ncbi:MAG: hypothetical protein KIS92_06850 [Planctomycetota bacterium]|nr:hypothetical protein [Planctomycetota bacterium]
MSENTSDSQASTRTDLPPKPPGDWPARATAPVPASKRRRGPWFGAMVALGFLLGLPLVAGLFALLYVKLGFLDRAVKSAIEDALGPGASVGAVHVDGMEALRAEDLKVPPASGFKDPVIQAGKVTVEWSPWSLAFDKRIRSLEVAAPEIDLRRNERGDWNLQMAAGGPEPAYRLEQAHLKDGTLKVEWQKGSAFSLEKVDVTLSRPDAPLPSPLTLRARFPSGSEVRGDFLLGPGANRRGSLTTLLDLEKDAPGALGPGASGKVGVRADLNLETLQEQDGWRTAGDFGLELGLTALRMPLGEGLAAVCPNQTVTVQGEMSGTPNGIPALRNLQLRVEGIGQAAAGTVEYVDRKDVPGAPFVRVAESGVRVRLNPLRDLFEPRLGGPSLSTEGDAVLEGFEAVVPLGGDVRALKYAGRFRASGLMLAFPGLGSLPPLDVAANFEIGAQKATLKEASLRLGDVAEAAFGASATWENQGLDALAILKRLNVQKVQFDLARLFDTDLGRRLAGQQLDLARPAPTLDELPVLAKGLVSARDLKVDVKEEGGRATLTIPGIAVRGLELLRWPLKLPLPANGFDGRIDAAAVFEKGALGRVGLYAMLQSATDAQMQAKLRLEAVRGADGKLAVRRAEFDALRLPLAELARFAGLKDIPTLQWKGMVKISNGYYDFQSGEIACDVELDGLAAEAMLTENFRGGLSNVIGKARLTLKDGRVTLSGTLVSGDARLINVSQLPAPTQFTLEAPLGGGTVRLGLAQESGWRANVEADLAKDGEDAYRLSGKVGTTSAGGLAFSYEAVLDLAHKEIAGIRLVSSQMDLATASRELLAPFMPGNLKLAGKVKDARLEIERVKLSALTGPLRGIRPLNGSLSGTLADGRFEHEISGSEGDDLDGTFRVNFGVTDQDAVILDVGARFTRYQMLVGGPVIQSLYGKVAFDLLGGQFYIPTLPDRALSAKMLVRREKSDGYEIVRLDKLLFDLENLARFELSGNLQAPAGGDYFYKGDGLLTQNLSLYDLAAAQRELGVPNLRLRHPLLAQAKVQGRCALSAMNQWSGEQSAIRATLRLNKVGLSVGGERPLEVKDLDGPLPLTFYRGLWPANWPREDRGTLTITSAKLDPFTLPQQPIAIIATPNAVAMANPLVLDLPGGRIAVEKLRMQDFFALEPAVRFDVDVKGVSMDQLARAERWNVGGLGETVLAGRLVNAALVRTSGPLGSWTFASEGELRAPLYQGTLRVGGFKARGLFGTSPVWGAWLKVENMSMLQFTGQNKQLGRMKSIADLSIADFTSTGLGLESIQTFVFDLDTKYRPDVEDEYDGRLALLLARPMVEDAMRRYNKTEAEIAAMKFGIKRAGLRFVLSAGRLRGPEPKLPDGKIIEGRGAYSPDVEGVPNASISWQDAVARLREHMAKLSKLPE